MKSALRVALVGALLLSACATASPTPAAGGSGAYRVFLASGASGAGGVDVVDTATRAVRNLPNGTLSPDGTRLFVIRVANGAPTLSAVDPGTGVVLTEKPISSGNLDAPGIISADGRWLVRSHHTGDGTPVTKIAIFDTRDLSEHDISLRGFFDLDAISNSGSILYLLETVGPDQYRVRDYEVANDRLDATVIVDKTDASPVMNGSRVAAVGSADGQKVFGLYQRPGKPPFVHVLWVTDKLAWCVDLPVSGVPKSDSQGWSLVLDEGRSLLFVIHSAGIISQIDISNLPALMRTESFVPPPATVSWDMPWVRDASAKGYEGAGMSGRSALSTNGKTLYIPDGSGYMTVGSDSLHPTGRSLSGYRLTSLALSPDGKRLFAVQPASNLLLEVDTANGREVARFPTSHPLGVLRVEAA